jgi:excisionase family DNA binding protein
MNPSRRWVSICEAAKFLGIHPQTAYSWADSGILPIVRLGPKKRTIRVDLKKLQRQLEDQANGAMSK